jgi:ABC-2 type transport system ATP-binding protein
MTTTSSATRPALKISGLRKTFGDKVVLDGIDLEIAAGTVFALLGPNGAGKTTTVQILSTLLDADDGRVEVAGFPASPPRCRAPAGESGPRLAATDTRSGITRQRPGASLGRRRKSPRHASRARLAIHVLSEHASVS